MRQRLFILLIAFLAVCPAATAGDEWKTLSVEKTFDDRPFSYLEKPLAERPGYKILRLQYPSPIVTEIKQNNTVPADFYLPDEIKAGDPRRPAVICLHILDGNEPLTDMVCSTLAARGIPAIAFKLPYYGQRGLPEGPMAMAKDPKLFADAIEQTNFDVRRTVDLLASRPEIDPQKIGISGISLGGIIAASAAGDEPRIHRAAMLLAGGDVLGIIDSAQETKLLSQTIKGMTTEDRAVLIDKINAVDPLRAAVGLRDRALNGQVLMINATEDEVVPKKCTEKLANALAIRDKVLWLDGLGHYSAAAELPLALKTTSDFFALDLPPGVAPPSTASRSSEMKKLAGVLQQAATLMAKRPEKEKCHSVDLQFSANFDQDPPFEGHLQVRRDAGKRFSVSCKLAKFGAFTFGQCDYPWIVADGAVLIGTANPAPTLQNPSDILTKHYETGFRSLAGFLNASSTTPEILSRFVNIEKNSPSGGRPGIMLTGKDSIPLRAEMIFQNDEKTLSEIKFTLGSMKGTIQFTQLEADVPVQPNYFAPPAELSMKKVDQNEVYQRFKAILSLVSFFSSR
jgi:dienelactone hydrolase